MGRPRGRPKKNKDLNLEETPRGEGLEYNYRGKKRHNLYSLAEKLRDEIDPSVYIQTLKTIMMGQVPLWVDDARVQGGIKVIADPNPLLPSPTLEQRTSAMREMINRQEGLPVQSIQMDAHFKAQLDSGLPEHLLAQSNMALLAKVASLINEYKESNIEDAVLVEPLQLTDQVETPTNSSIERSVPDPHDVPINVSTNKNSDPEEGPL